MSKKITKVTSSHWGAFQVTVRNNVIEKVMPFADDPNPSEILSAIPKAIHHHTRVSKPSIRKGWLSNKEHHNRDQRGEDDFIEVPWDEALDITANELDHIKIKYGNGAIFGGSYGWASAGRFHHALSQVHRFLNSIGGYVSSYASYSTAAAQAIIPHVFGVNFLKFTWGYQNSWPTILKHTEVLIMFGGINPKNSQVSMGGVTRHEIRNWLIACCEKKIDLVNISPQKTDTIDDIPWVPIIPGSDTALMLALAYILETQNLCDRDFIATHTTGYDRFSKYLLGSADGQPKSPEWAAKLCGIKPVVIYNLAKKMAGRRTLITVSWSLQRGQNGEQPYWMAATLASMLGQIGLPGGGIGYGYGAIGGIGLPIERLDGLRLPQGENLISDFIPVARIADMLLNPKQRYDFNGEQRQYPDIRLIYWCGGNPFHHHQDLNRLSKAWTKPETIVVHEPWWTATARRADIVLPATTPFEREDIGRAASDSYLFYMPKLIEPIGEARDDYTIFSALASRLGNEKNFTEGRDSDQWLRYLYAQFFENAASMDIEIPSYDQLKEINWVELPIRVSDHDGIALKDFRDNPKTNPLGTPSGKIEIFSETINGFNYKDISGHPIWKAPDEWLGGIKKNKYKIHLVSPQPRDKLHSQLEPAIADSLGCRPVEAIVNELDADEKGILNYDTIRVFNDRGSCLATAVISRDIRRGVMSIPTGAWFEIDPNGIDKNGNPNILTRDIGTSKIGQGSTAHTTLVDIERWLPQN